MSIKIAGVMTGTSCDGLDVACVEFEGEGAHLRWHPLWSQSVSYPAALRRRVLAAQAPGARLDLQAWLGLHRDLGRWYASTLSRILRAQGPRHAPHAIANHGQTVAHFPDNGLTLQLGDPSLIARAAGLTVISSFREGDLAAGGQGAPLAPGFHRVLLRDVRAGVSVHNLGGISNLTYFGPRGKTLSFDTGPGNAWIDAAAGAATRGRLKMDVDGKLARAGSADEKAVRAILSHPYFRKAAPKSTGRNEFAFELLLARTRAKGADLVATATEIAVRSIVLAYESSILRRGRPLRAIYFCGGGAKNPSILDGVALGLPGVAIHRIEDLGLDGQMIEAQAFAYCGYLALLGKPVGGEWTGAKNFAPPAHIIPGENWAKLVSKLRETRSHG